MNLMPFAVVPLALLSSAASHPHRHQENRNPEVPREFQRTHPCPSTGKTTGACPGYVRDHVVPLCKGGADMPSNMQWQTVRDAKEKDRWECR